MQNIQVKISHNPNFFELVRVAKMLQLLSEKTRNVSFSSRDLPKYCPLLGQDF